MTDRFRPPPLRDQLIALLVAIVCGLAFLGPAVSPGNALVPYSPELRDRLAASEQPPQFDAEVCRGNLAMGDKYNQSLTWDRITKDRFLSGEIPTWTRDIAGGVPFVPQMGQVYEPFNLLLFFLPSTGVYGIWWLLHLVLFGFFAYRFQRRLNLDHVPAVFGMVALILGLWTQARLHHNVMLTAALPVFAALSCTHHLFRCNGRLGHMALLALCVGISWLAGFAPGSLMCTYLVCAYAVVLWWRSPRGERLAPLFRFGFAVALGLLLAAAQLLPVLQAAAVTSRGTATIEALARQSLEFDHLWTGVWPTLFNWPGDHLYHDLKPRPTWPALAYLEGELFDSGFNYPETAFYAGLAPLVLACGAWGFPVARFFGAAALFGLAMALGLLLPVSQYLPGAHSGDVKRFLLLFGIATPIVGAFGLQRVLGSGPRRLPLVVAIGVTVISATLFALHLGDPTALTEFYGSRAEALLGLDPGTFEVWIANYPTEPAVNQSKLLWVFGSAATCGACLCLALLRPGPLTAALLIGVTAVELVFHGHGPVVAVPNEEVTKTPAILEPVLASAKPNGVRPRLQRVMPPLDKDPFHYPVWPNLAAFHGAEDLGAYNPLPKSRMEDYFLLIEPNSNGMIKQSVVLGGAGVGAFRDPESLTHPLTELLGIEWVMTMQPLDLPEFEEQTPEGVAPPYRLYRRKQVMPRATFSTSALFFRGPGLVQQHLRSRGREPRTRVLLEAEGLERLDQPPAKATVRITKHADEEVVIKVQTDRKGYLRLADPYDAGWTATVDGVETPVYPADLYFRAVFVAPGDHEVVFRYNGIRVWGPQLLSLLALLGVLLLGVLGRLSRPRTV